MKVDQPFLAIVIIGILDLIVGFFVISNNFEINKKTNYSKVVEGKSYTEEQIIEDGIENSIHKIVDVSVDEKEISNDLENSSEQETLLDPIVYDGMTLDELSNKLDRSLNSTLSGTGYLFANRSIELGLDPYLAVAIVLHETGCKWECSQLVTVCNNVGGQKGAPGCFGGSYKSFNTLEEGINNYLDNLYNNYYSLGLTTAETINPKYAESTTWASKVNYYINLIKQS